MQRKMLYVALIVIVIALVCTVVWYIKANVKLVTKEERRAVVASELNIALERYYDEHGRYPVVGSNEELMRELSAKKYFNNDVRIDVVQYVPVNNGQTYELR
jgi:type II secretory pathway pseudopilin PulG